MQNLMQTFLSVTQTLEKNNIEYMVVGSIASMIYGEPRLTHDMDVVLDILPSDAQKIETLFSNDEFYCPHLEAIKSEITYRGQFNLIHQKSGLKIDLLIRKDTEHARCEFLRKVQKPFLDDFEVYVAAP
jgi:hypothetical protein